MRKAILFLPLLLCGCIFSFKAPVPVEQARAQRSEATSRYVVNSTALIDFAIRMYQQSEYARVDALYMQDILAAKALPDASAAVTKMIDLDAKRDVAKGKVDAQVAKFRAIATKAQTDPIIAMKLDEAISQYEAAGIDASAIPGTVDGILSVLKTFGGK